MNDWRIRNQIDYLWGKVLIYRDYEAPSAEWDHDHCEFCSKKFSENGIDLATGYTVEGNWICDECFNDFKDLFSWTVAK